MKTMSESEIVMKNLPAFRSACREAIERAIAQGSRGGNSVVFAVKYDDNTGKFRIAVLSPGVNPSDYIFGAASKDHAAFRSDGVENVVDEAVVYACTIEY